MNPRPVICLTMGDPAGIGPELCLRALREASVLDSCVPVLFGNAGVLKRLAEAGLPVPECRVVSAAEWDQAGPVREPTVGDCAVLDSASIRPGEVSATCGKAGYAFIEQAIGAAMAKKVGAV